MKMNLPEQEIREIRDDKKVIFFSRKYVTNWGGRNTLRSILLLSKEAIKNPQNEYIHLISGGDFPVKNSSAFIQQLRSNKDKEFIENFPLPTTRWANGGLNRLYNYNLYDVFNGKEERGANAIRMVLKIQEKLKFKRKISKNIPPLYGGSTWWTLSRSCLQYVIDYTQKHPMLLQSLKHSFCSEEIYFQTVIMNSPFSKQVVDSNLRFIKWVEKHGSMPAILDENDLDEMVASNSLFARKIEYPFSAELVSRLIKMQ